MGAFRRHLVALSLAGISIQAFAVTCGAVAECCRPGQGEARADGESCPMHHGAGEECPMRHSGHTPSAPSDSGDCRMICGTSFPLLGMFQGLVALLPSPPMTTAAFEVAAIALFQEPPIVDVWFPPQSPPPRT